MKINIHLLPLCLAISLIGILILLFISTIQPSQVNIDDINNKPLNKQVKIQGQIQSIKSFEDSNFQIISIQDKSSKIDITIDKILSLENNQTITIVGKVTKYNETLQIQADKIY